MIPIQPADTLNRAIDMLGAGPDRIIGSLEDGTKISEWGRRNYGPTLRALLRAAHWNFARKRAPLLLLGDASGQTLAPSGDPLPTTVEPPWLYAYAWPVDAVQAIWLPLGQPPQPTPPLMPNLAAGAPWAGQVPARFLVSSSDDFPSVIGQTDWDALPDLAADEGVGPIGRRIILTNVPNACLVFTKLALSAEEWDPLFGQALVATLAGWLALLAIDDRKTALAERDRQILIAKGLLADARTANGNDAGFPQSPIRHVPAAIRARRSGPYGGAWGFDGGWGPAGCGQCFYGWQAIGWADGSVF